MPHLDENFQKMPRRSLRKKGWDYSCTAIYLITFNIASDSPKFGKLSKSGVVLNDLGLRVKSKWEEIPQRIPNVRLGEYIIMPNHIHGIIYFIEGENNTSTTTEFGPQRRNLPAVMRGFKSGFTSEVKDQYPKFKWHLGFHDRILFTQYELATTVKYIRNNPAKAFKKLNP